MVMGSGFDTARTYRFESCPSIEPGEAYQDVAQLAEYLVRSEEVVGSSPTILTQSELPGGPGLRRRLDSSKGSLTGPPPPSSRGHNRM